MGKRLSPSSFASSVIVEHCHNMLRKLPLLFDPEKLTSRFVFDNIYSKHCCWKYWRVVVSSSGVQYGLSVMSA